MPSSLPHVRQPEGSKLCGAACVAMLADVPLEDAVGVIGHHRGTTTRELVTALRFFGFRPPRDRLTPVRGRGPLPHCFIGKVPNASRSNWHWVVVCGDWWHDPALHRAVEDPAGAMRVTLTAYLEVRA